MSRFTTTITWLALLSCGLPGEKPACAAERRPNILLIVGDDVGYSDLGVYGGEIPTPHLDGLARSGLRFTNFHMGPIGATSRSMFLTGIDHHRIGLGMPPEFATPDSQKRPGYEGYLLQNNVTIARLLNDAGYHTFMAGKWGLGQHDDNSPHARGFEETYVLMQGAGNHFNSGGVSPSQSVSTYRRNGRVIQRPDGVYSTPLWTDQMLAMIGRHHGDGRPFFAYVAYTACHWPLQAPPDDIELFGQMYVAGWDQLRLERFLRMQRMGMIDADAKLPPKNRLVTGWPSVPYQHQAYEVRKMVVYAAMVHSLDRGVGQLLDYLKEIGEYDNTVIVFTSDNGAAPVDPAGELSSPPMRDWVAENFDNSYENLGGPTSFVGYGPHWANACVSPLAWFKGYVAEGGTRVPFLIRYPGVTSPGQRAPAFAHAKDLAATILDIAGVKHPGTSFQGREILPIDDNATSLLPHLQGRTGKVHEDGQPVGFELFGNRALVVDDWKITLINLGMHGPGRWHLYNLRQDPAEQYPLEYEHPEFFKEMMRAYNAYEKRNQVVRLPPDFNPWEALH